MAEVKVKRQSFEKGAVVLLFSTVAVKLIGALFKIPLANLLGDTGNGYFSSVYDIFTPFYVLAMSGLPVAAARAISAFNTGGRYNDIRRTEHITRRLFWIIGIAGTALFVLLVPLLSAVTDSNADTRYGFLAVAPSVLLFCIISYYRGIYEGLENMTPTAVSDLIEAMGKLCLGYGFAWAVMHRTSDYVLASAAALLGITVGVALAAVYLAIRHRVKGDGITPQQLQNAPCAIKRNGEYREFLSLAVPVAVSAVAVACFASLSDALTVRRCLAEAGVDNAIELYGVRSKAYTLYNLVPTVTTALGISAVPKISAASSSNRQKTLKKYIFRLLRLAAVTAVPAGVGLCVMAKPIMRLLYNSSLSYTVGARLLALYGIAAIFAGLSVPIIHALQAVGKQKSALGILAVGMLLKLILNLLLVSNSDIGIVGAAFATFAAYLTVCVLGLALLCKTAKIKGVLRLFVNPALASLCCPLAAYFANQSQSKAVTLAAIVLAVAAYFAVIFALKTFSLGEIMAFPGGKKLLKIIFKPKKSC